MFTESSNEIEAGMVSESPQELSLVNDLVTDGVVAAPDHLTEQCNRPVNSSVNRPVEQDIESTAELPLTTFRNYYVGYMDLYGDRQTVMDYLDAHEGWFKRCAHPFKADSIAKNGYAIGVGCVGALGFNVDARVGLNLLPQDQGIYRIVTIPIPGQEPQQYDVDFSAEMQLEERQPNQEQSASWQVMTAVEWQLELTVSMQFPKFIHRLSNGAIQATGDKVLAYIVKKVSQSLTAKVEADFHKTMDVKIPRKHRLRARKPVSLATAPVS
ncbi:Protein of unknown function DUF1997 [Thalassoporum mexicanum PCC 7367]|uniref:DUF1997 domain-containing protein n=1 Tax=Thalassoporum mexicanum TaxID=3457544 RepID=UPI00029FAC03|nr:DUF1997 domain-containing protein [Pseudanabaena sp. PCC 7367]AFY69672.1 Protein of unknown function DUF1997 [Pseudanabaena sp. PCC 7367]